MNVFLVYNKRTVSSSGEEYGFQLMKIPENQNGILKDPDHTQPNLSLPNLHSLTALQI